MYRPGYTTELISLLDNTIGGIRDSTIADIGSGTGKLTEPLLNALAKVYAVEPNEEMRNAADRMMTDYRLYHSIKGTAEATTLPNQSMDAIVVAQAFHWFDPIETKKEFKRILGDVNCNVFLIWNNRNDDEKFMKAYEQYLLKYSTDYSEINHKKITSAQLSSFFGKEGFQLAEFENNQFFDFDGLKGRYDSCSYALPDTHELYPESISSLQSLFDRFNIDGQITMYNSTTVHFGKL